MMRTLSVWALFFVSSFVFAAPDLIVYNAKITGFDGEEYIGFTVKDGRFTHVSNDAASLMRQKADHTQLIDAKGRRVIPGLNDSHSHVVRGGRFYNLETRWEGVTSLKEALALLTAQAKRTPDGQWVRVIGGWTPNQFEEKRMPTLKELNDAVPDKPLFVLHLYSGGFLNKAGVRALGLTKDTPAPEGSVIEKDENGNPTGLLIADPHPTILYQTVAALPQLSEEEQLNSTLQFYNTLLSLGVTSAIDAGGGGHQFPEDYASSTLLAEQAKLPLRVSNYLFPQKPGKEAAQFHEWMHNFTADQHLGQEKSNDFIVEGGGELLVWSASDYENFRSARPELKANFERELSEVIKLHLENRWPFRIHATYDESIGRMLDVLERVNKTIPLSKVRWAIDHAETVSDNNLQRIHALGGGIAVQGRLAFAGEDFLARYGEAQTKRSPPINKMLEMGIPVGLGTDGTRVSSFNPWATYYWAVTGRSVGGTLLNDQPLDRLTALRLFTHGSAWFSGDEDAKGAIQVGMLADFSILNHDILKVDARQLLETRSVMTVVGGKLEYVSDAYPEMETKVPTALPTWSPVNLPVMQTD